MLKNSLTALFIVVSVIIILYGRLYFRAKPIGIVSFYGQFEAHIILYNVHLRALEKPMT